MGDHVKKFKAAAKPQQYNSQWWEKQEIAKSEDKANWDNQEASNYIRKAYTIPTKTSEVKENMDAYKANDLTGKNTTEKVRDLINPIPYEGLDKEGIPLDPNVRKKVEQANQKNIQAKQAYDKNVGIYNNTVDKQYSEIKEYGQARDEVLSDPETEGNLVRHFLSGQNKGDIDIIMQGKIEENLRRKRALQQQSVQKADAFSKTGGSQ